MAIIDKELIFTKTTSDGSACGFTPIGVTAGASRTVTIDSGFQKVIDLGADGDALGGHELTFTVVGNGAAVTSAPTLKASWKTCSNSSFAASDTKEIAVTPAVPIVANGGVMYRMKIMDNVKRFNKVELAVNVVSGGAVASSTAGVAPGVMVYLSKEQ